MNAIERVRNTSLREVESKCSHDGGRREKAGIAIVREAALKCQRERRDQLGQQIMRKSRRCHASPGRRGKICVIWQEEEAEQQVEFYTYEDERRRVQVWTDGNVDPTVPVPYRCAGARVCWSRGNSSNLPVAVKGHAQTNQRAQMDAILAVMQTIRDTVRMFTNSGWSASRIQNIVSHGQQGHKDLWRAVCSRTRSKAIGTCRITWIREHATESHIQP